MAASFIFDAHLDLALNAIEWNRDLRLPLGEIRRSEAHLHDKPGRDRGTVAFPEMRRARVGLGGKDCSAAFRLPAGRVTTTPR